MRRPSRQIAAGLLAVFLAGLVGGSSLQHPAEPRRSAEAALFTVPPTFYEAVDEARAQGQDTIDMDLIVPTPAEMPQVREAVRALGGEVLQEEHTYAQVKVPLAVADTLPTALAVTAVGTNQPVKADQATLVPSGSTLSRNLVSDLVRHNLEPSEITTFRHQYGVDGTGITIAVIDSGIDPGHADLRQTPDGRPKLIDWKDFTGEGLVKTSSTVDWGATYTAPDGKIYRLPPKPAASRTARFGYWDESKVVGRNIDRDLDRNSVRIDRFGVLVVDSILAGYYDLVYVDTNNDGDFTDERPLRVFRDTQEIGRMGRFRSGDVADQQLYFVVSDLESSGNSVQFGFDGLGHGTQVAGVLAASSSQGLTGVAPGAQLMALKVINSQDQGDWFQIRSAILYAVENGARVINLSLGGLSIASQPDSTATAFLNQVARTYGVLIVMASDNTGPGLSGGTTIGNPHEMLAVGAYYSPTMWSRDYGYVVPTEGLWWRTGMGPRSDGSYAPNLVAPGGSPATSPRWLDATGYVTAAGTSIAAPHVSGSAALLIEAGRRNGLPYDRFSIKRALELGATSLPGLEVFEQGRGLLKLNQAFQQLQQIGSGPDLSGQTADGKGGILARSYRPGNSSLILSNLGADLTRVQVTSSDPWVRPAMTSLTMPPKEVRTLPVQLDPPALPGVHTAFVTLTDPGRYGTGLDIPVTYVRPVGLTDNRYTAVERVEVTRYRRYFVEVAPGTARLQVSTRVVVGPAGTSLGSVQVQVFRPDGKLAFRSYEFGATGNGLSTQFTTDQPREGVWEVVVTALPDTTGTNLSATYQMGLEVTPAQMDLPIRLHVPAGSTTTHTIRLANPYTAFFGQVEAYGLVPDDGSKSWEVVSSLNAIDQFTLPIAAARVRLETDNALPANVDLGLWLYRGNQVKWWSVQPGQNKEAIDLPGLAPGTYSVFVTNTGSASSGLQYQYRRLVAPLAYHLSLKDEPRRRERGSTWTMPLTVYAPTSPGRYKGQIILMDLDRAESVAWYPIEVSVGLPTLTVTPLVSQLRMGEPGTVVLEVRNSDTRALVDATVTVNGQRYLTRNGRATVLVRPTESIQTLKVDINLPKYRYFSQELRVPVRNTWGAHPTGVDASPENTKWRLKVEFLLP